MSLVFNIQKYSTHDGDGIRTTIFFKGCPLSCIWCHNPESQRYEAELIFYQEKCKKCGACVEKCPHQANSVAEDGTIKFDRSLCQSCGICADWCAYEAREIAGKEYTVDELVKESKKDLMFYEESHGGVTLSGGEVMAQNMDFVEELCRKLHGEGISVFIDTCGYAPYESFERILPYVDVFLYDIKVLDPEKHKKFIGVDNTKILENLCKISKAGGKIYIRIPVIVGVNAEEAFMEDVITFLHDNQIAPLQVSLLPYHSFGKSKYPNLGRTYDAEALMVPTDEQMALYQNIFEKHGHTNTVIGG